jgi:hypothetical protein
MSRLSEVLTAILPVQEFGRGGYGARRFEEESSANFEEGIRLARLVAVVSRSVGKIGNIGSAVVVAFGVLKSPSGTDHARRRAGVLIVRQEYFQANWQGDPADRQADQCGRQRATYRRYPEH